MTDKDLQNQFSLLNQIAKATTETAVSVKQLNTSLLDVVANAKAGGEAGQEKKQPQAKQPSGTLNVSDIVKASKEYDARAQKNSQKLLDFLVKLDKDFIDKLDPKKTEQFSQFIKGVSLSILTFSKNLFFATPMLMVATLGAKMFAVGLNAILGAFAKLKEKDVKNIERAVPLIGEMGKAILLFSGTMALATLIAAVVITNPLGVLALVASIGVMAFTFGTVGKYGKEIEKGSSAVNHMSLSILGFSASIALSSLIVSAVDPMNLAMVGLTLLGMGFAFGMIGKFDKEVKKGSIAVGFMSLSLLVFSASVAFSAKMVADTDPMNLALLGGTLIGLGLIYGIAGKFFKEIAFGALAFAAVGLSLMILASPIEQISKAVGENTDVLWQLPVVLGSLGLTYGIAGGFLVPILLGALAFSAIGGSLWILSSGIKDLLSVGTITEEDAEGIKLGISAVITGIGKSFEELSWAQALAMPLTIPMVGLAGMALIPLATGIAMWKNKVGNWNEEDSDNLKYTIASMNAAFATAGSSEGMSTLFGFPVGSNDVERGIESTMKMGKNLTKLSEGIMAWKKMDLSPEAIQVVADNIQRVLNVIPGIFASIGRRDRENEGQPSSFLGMLIGTDFNDSDTEAGIESTMKIGENLKNLSDGIMAWKNMKLTPEEIQPIADNIQRVLNVIPAIFASIGRRERGNGESSSILGMLIGTDFSTGDTQAGIEATEKLGTNLKTLSEGVMAWKDVDPKAIPQINSNIMSILGVIPKAFAEVGKMENDSEGWFSDGNVGTGIEMVGNMGKPLKDISKLVDSLKEIPDPSVFGMKIGIGIKYLIKNVMEAAAGINEKDLKKLEKVVNPLEKMAKIFKTLNEEMKKQFDYIAKLDKTYLQNFATWADALHKISQSGEAFLQKGFDTGRGITDLRNEQAAPTYNTTPQTTSAPITKTVTSKDVTPQTAKKNPAAKPVGGNDAVAMALESLANQISSLVAEQKASNQQLAAIKLALQGTIKTKEVM